MVPRASRRNRRRVRTSAGRRGHWQRPREIVTGDAAGKRRGLLPHQSARLRLQRAARGAFERHGDDRRRGSGQQFLQAFALRRIFPQQRQRTFSGNAYPFSRLERHQSRAQYTLRADEIRAGGIGRKRRDAQQAFEPRRSAVAVRLPDQKADGTIRRSGQQ